MVIFSPPSHCTSPLTCFPPYFPPYIPTLFPPVFLPPLCPLPIFLTFLFSSVFLPHLFSSLFSSFFSLCPLPVSCFPPCLVSSIPLFSFHIPSLPSLYHCCFFLFPLPMSPSFSSLYSFLISCFPLSFVSPPYITLLSSVYSIPVSV